jgi:uncharacterized membrane protein YhaH (DUF805 family)
MTTLLVLTLVFAYTAWIVFAWSLYIRRWHDLGKSGWYSLLNFVPLVSLIVLIYLFFAKGEEATNAYGVSDIGKPFWDSLFGHADATEPIPAPSMPSVPPSVGSI